MKLKNGVLAADRLLLSILYPDGVLCAACGEPSYGAVLCPACRQGLQAERTDRINGCVASVWNHAGVPRRLVLQLKHGGTAAAAGPLADGMAALAAAFSLPDDTVVTWVTMPAWRKRKRGIDHGRILAELVAARLGLPCSQLLIRDSKAGRTAQHRLTGAQRRTNLKSAFSAIDCAGKTVLLTDDVYTTGATAQACTAALNAAGCRRVFVLTATTAHELHTGDEPNALV